MTGYNARFGEAPRPFLAAFYPPTVGTVTSVTAPLDGGELREHGKEHSSRADRNISRLLPQSVCLIKQNKNNKKGTRN